MLLWASSRHDNLTHAWNLFEEAERKVDVLSPFSLSSLFMECEQKGLLHLEIVLLESLSGAVGNLGIEMGFGAVTKHVTAIRFVNDLGPAQDSYVCGVLVAGNGRDTHHWIHGHGQHYTQRKYLYSGMSQPRHTTRRLFASRRYCEGSLGCIRIVAESGGCS